MNFSSLLSYLVLVCLVSSVALHVNGQEDKALEWFHSEYANFFKPNLNDTTPPTITGATIVPSFLKVGDPVADITANVHDPAGIKTVYALVGNRMNLMVDLTRTGQYTGYCGSNLPPGIYKVTIVAIDRVGNAARAEASTNLTILDPRDLNGNHIEDSLENQMNKSLRVIVLHEGNLSGAEKFKIIPGSSMIVPGSKLDELAHLKGVKGIYEDKKLRVWHHLGIIRRHP